MPAPTYAYRTFGFKEGTTELDATVALCAIPDAIESVLKARYHLDYLFMTGVGNALGTAIDPATAGFIGGCIEGSNNYYMHNLARRFKMKGRSELGQNLWFYNDAGLNTLATALINSNNLLWANNVRFNTTFNSSYWDTSTQLGIQFRKVGTSTWNTHWLLGETLPQQQSVTKNVLFDTALNPGDNVEARAVIVNAEGTFYQATPITITLLDRVFEYDALYRASGACVDTGQVNVSFWVKENDMLDLSTVTTVSSNTGIYFWKNIELTTKADAGWYMGLDNDKSFYVDSTGQVTHYQDCPIAPPQVTLAVEDDIYGNMQVWATLDGIKAYNVTIVGRIDVDPLNATPFGADFEIIISAGNTTGTDVGFSFVRNPSVTYYWQNAATIPAGFVINKQMPI